MRHNLNDGCFYLGPHGQASYSPRYAEEQGSVLPRSQLTAFWYTHSLGHRVQQAAGCFNKLTAHCTYTGAVAPVPCQPRQFTPVGVRIRRVLALAVLTVCIRATSTSLMAFFLRGAMYNEALYNEMVKMRYIYNFVTMSSNSLMGF